MRPTRPLLTMLALAALAPLAAADPLPPRMLNGLETIRFDEHTIIAYRGSAVDNTGDHLMVIERRAAADIRKVGVGGRDDSASKDDVENLRNLMVSAPGTPSGYRSTYRRGPYENKALEGWYTPVYVGRPVPDGDFVETELILTRHQSSARINTEVNLNIDPAYTVRRNAPIAHYYDPEIGFRPMICYGWPKAFCVWTHLGNLGIPNIADNLRGDGSMRLMDASAFVPPTGRILRMRLIIESTGGSGAVRVGTLSSGARIVAYVDDNDPVEVEVVNLSLTSRRTFYLQVPEGVSVDIVPLGFSMEQPT